MKVRITLTLDVDADAWAAEYGIPRDQVRDDVRAHITHTALSTLLDAGLLRVARADA